MKIFVSHRSRENAMVREFKSMLPGFLRTRLDEESLRWGDDFPVKLKTTIQSERGNDIRWRFGPGGIITALPIIAWCVKICITTGIPI